MADINTEARIRELVRERNQLVQRGAHPARLRWVEAELARLADKGSAPACRRAVRSGRA